jgi:MFS family permease
MQSTQTNQQQEAPSRPSLWRNRDYMLLWSGQLVSNIGSQVSQLAFPLLILALTHSPAQAGIAAALRALPYLILSLPAGALIDRWDRKLVMIICDVGRALALGSIPVALLFGRLTIAQIFIVTTIEGTLFVFFNIAEVACLPRVVARDQLPAANSQYAATDGIMTIIGPPVGGALYAVGSMFPFLTDAISYTASVISLLFIKTNFQEKRTASQRRLWIEIREGLSWLWHQPLIRFIAILTGGNNLISAGLMLLLIVLGQRLHASSVSIGLIFTIAGIGGVLGAIVAPFIQKRFTFAQVIIASSWVFGLATPLYLIAPNVFVLGLITAAAFITGPIYNVVQLSYRSALIPDRLQGRVNSVFRLIAFGGQPIGAALIGFLLQGVGIEITIWFCSIVLLLLAVAATFNKHVRHARPISEVMQEAH